MVHKSQVDTKVSELIQDLYSIESNPTKSKINSFLKKYDRFIEEIVEDFPLEALRIYKVIYEGNYDKLDDDLRHNVFRVYFSCTEYNELPDIQYREAVEKTVEEAIENTTKFIRNYMFKLSTAIDEYNRYKKKYGWLIDVEEDIDTSKIYLIRKALELYRPVESLEYRRKPSWEVKKEIMREVDKQIERDVAITLAVLGGLTALTVYGIYSHWDDITSFVTEHFETLYILGGLAFMIYAFLKD